MTAQEKRLEVAKDALKQIQGHKTTVKTGNFFVGTLANTLFINREQNDSAQEFIKNGFKEHENQESIYGPVCQVCAKGSLFISHILLFNEISCSEVCRTDERSAYQFLPEFSEELLDEFEYLFELRAVFLPDVSPSKKSILEGFACKNGLEFLYPEDRLKFLLELFIKNKGEFLVLH